MGLVSPCSSPFPRQMPLPVPDMPPPSAAASQHCPNQATAAASLPTLVPPRNHLVLLICDMIKKKCNIELLLFALSLQSYSILQCICFILF